MTLCGGKIPALHEPQLDENTRCPMLLLRPVMHLTELKPGAFQCKFHACFLDDRPVLPLEQIPTSTCRRGTAQDRDERRTAREGR